MVTSQATRQAQLARAIAEFNAGNETSATQGCLRLLAEAPEDAAAHQLLATIAFRAGRFAEAERHIGACLHAQPHHVQALLLAGQIAQAGGDLRLAALRLEQAVALDPGRPDAAFAYCRIWLALAGDAQSGPTERPDFTQIMSSLLARFPDFASGWRAVGADLERMGQLDAALVATARAVKASPSVAGYLAWAQLALRLARPREAADALQRALDLDPTMAAVWFKLGVVLQDCGEPDGAIAAYRRALALDADMAEAATNLGIMLQDAGELDAAKCAYGQALRARADSFGRISQALTAAPRGELWADLAALRVHLLACGIAADEPITASGA